MGRKWLTLEEAVVGLYCTIILSINISGLVGSESRSISIVAAVPPISFFSLELSLFTVFRAWNLHIIFHILLDLFRNIQSLDEKFASCLSPLFFRHILRFDFLIVFNTKYSTFPSPSRPSRDVELLELILEDAIDIRSSSRTSPEKGFSVRTGSFGGGT